MRKIKRFNLNQSHLLSSSEMAKLSGGEYLYTTCSKEYIGYSCLHTSSDGSHYTGVCAYKESSESDGSTTTTTESIFCKKL